MGERIACEVTVRGRVQGVFFRDTTRRVARELGVAGWVRNAADGSVVAHLEGEPAAVEQVLRFVRTGPAEARVEDVEERTASVEGLDRFEIR